jgi:hypothetical protein
MKLKYVVYVYKQSEHRPKLHVDGESVTESQIYTVPYDAAILYKGTCTHMP